MRPLLTILFFALALTTYSQQSFSEKDAANIVSVFFDGFHKGDTVQMRSVMAPNMVLQRAYPDRDGNNIVSTNNPGLILEAVVKRPADQKWFEKLLGYRFTRDGNLAHMWVPYEFYVNGQFSHCGANAFTLALTNNGWKIVHLIDSRRRDSCEFLQKSAEESKETEGSDEGN